MLSVRRNLHTPLIMTEPRSTNTANGHSKVRRPPSDEQPTGAFDLLASQIDALRQEIDYLKEQVALLQETALRERAPLREEHKSKHAGESSR